MRRYIIYTPQQKQLIKELYHTHSNAEIAQLLGIDKPEKVRDVARKCFGLKWRAENGVPKWRELKSRNHNLGRWAA
ncbi:MAG: hypothetical protein ACRYFK_14425 [Janthinobacterium lividum]